MTDQEKVPDITTEKDPKIEDESDDDSDDHEHHGHEHGHDHDHDHDHEGHAHGKGGEKKANKGEKKFKKAMTKLGMKPVPGINRVTIKKTKSVLLYIDNPEILKSPGADNTYVIFGEVKLQDFPGGLAANEANKYNTAEKPIKTDIKKEEAPAEKVVTDIKEEEGEISEEGVEASAIENVMNHTKCTRRQAVKALKESGNDPVAAIIALTG